MAEFASQQFELDKRQQDGATLRQHLEMAYKASGIMPEQLANELSPPLSIIHLWKYFIELHGERSSNGMSPGRITSTMIKDWCDVNRVRLDIWEIQAIKRLDNLWMESLND